MRYVDGFLLPLPKRNVRAYLRMAKAAARVWREHGALEYREAVGDDLATSMGIPFPRRAGTKSGETVVFAWVVYKSRAHRDRVNARVMKDPRITAMMKDRPMPFDCKRMSYGGFSIRVEA